MAFARTLKGDLQLRWEGKDYILTEQGSSDLPADLVKNIAPHVNVSTERAPEPEPESKGGGGKAKG